MAGQAGGRCRTFHDDALGCDIDNGNHLVLSGNSSIAAYLDECAAAEDLFVIAGSARFDFHDLESGKDWALDMGRGRWPGWLFDSTRRAPGTGAFDYLSGLKLAVAGDRTVSDLFAGNPAAFRSFWEPLAVAVLNTEPDVAAARLLWPVLCETIGRGGDACRPMIARDGLGPALVDPALGFLRNAGMDIRFGERLRSVEREGGQVRSLVFDSGVVHLSGSDMVLLALPSWTIARLLPDVLTPDSNRGISNIHYRMAGAVASPGEPFMKGIIGGIAQWVFARGDILSVTISASETYESVPPDELADQVFDELVRALGLDGNRYVQCRVIREKRATFTQSPEQLKRRNGAETMHSNLFLAGDWTATGLPATIEGAVRSGHIAVAKMLSTPGDS
jgi:squalene-associated FAD-dependent desaturase